MSSQMAELIEFYIIVVLELLADPQNPRYIIPLNIGGQIQGGDESNSVDIFLRNMVPRNANYFLPEDGPDGMRLRLVRAVDRDVS